MDKRGPAKRLDRKYHFTIMVISARGETMEPRKSATTFKNQCGVLVRDRVLISYREWNKTKKCSSKTEYVPDRYKDGLWEDLMANFTLPELPTRDETAKLRALVKKFALMKMGELFR